MSEPDADLYQTIAIGHDIAMYIINDSCLDVKVADLFLLNDDLDSMHAETQGQYMLLDGISTDDLLALLNAFREQGKPFEGIVVTRTKVNEVWTLSRLLAEVRREHALMETLKELDSLLEDCNGIDLSAMKTEDSNELKQALVEGYLLLKDEDQDIEEAREAVRKLRKAMEPAVRIVH